VQRYCTANRSRRTLPVTYARLAQTTTNRRRRISAVGIFRSSKHGIAQPVEYHITISGDGHSIGHHVTSSPVDSPSTPNRPSGTLTYLFAFVETAEKISISVGPGVLSVGGLLGLLYAFVRSYRCRNRLLAEALRWNLPPYTLREPVSTTVSRWSQLSPPLRGEIRLF